MCRTQKNLTKTPLSKEFIKNIENNTLTFNTLVIKGKGKYSDAKKNLGFNYNLHILSDSIIWMSCNVLGIEGLRIIITPQGIKVLDKLNRKYIDKDFDFLTKEMGWQMNFKTLQHLLLGNTAHFIVLPNTKSTDKERLNYQFEQNNCSVAYSINPTNFKINQINIKDAIKNAQSKLNFENFNQVETTALAFKVLLQTILPEPSTLLLEHHKIEKNINNLTFSFTIPFGYEKAE